jgi:hypothetical protein
MRKGFWIDQAYRTGGMLLGALIALLFCYLGFKIDEAYRYKQLHDWVYSGQAAKDIDAYNAAHPQNK